MHERKFGSAIERISAPGDQNGKRAHHNAFFLSFPKGMEKGATVGGVSEMGQGVGYLPTGEENERRKKIWFC